MKGVVGKVVYTASFLVHRGRLLCDQQSASEARSFSSALSDSPAD